MIHVHGHANMSKQTVARVIARIAVSAAGVAIAITRVSVAIAVVDVGALTLWVVATIGLELTSCKASVGFGLCLTLLDDRSGDGHRGDSEEEELHLA